ncbi:type II secretion system protein [Knoellia sinensis KCTC 19936]|uniref:Type II secretion system protein n=1 Tax=Knoellia sinensis KCTC 19936 TaxID=1385520 RepID=A0A0A0J4H6_9MICO|nr:type II secretion system F family protein [Knoellia sinensis]KGN32098.1 type II secretion system protein [Knoellia sinensis KCTC 19936]
MLLVALLLVAVAVWVWPARHGPVRAGAPGADGIRAGCERERGEREGGEREGGEREGDATATVDDAADALVLCGLVLRAGLGPVEALEAVAQHVPGPIGHQLRVVASAHRWGQDSATAWAHVGAEWQPAALAWQAAERSGAAPAGVVLAAAERMRREEGSRVEAAVLRAGVLLVLPLGACFLPGFIGTTVVPVVLHLARSTLSAG